MRHATVSKPELTPDRTDAKFRVFVQNFLAVSSRVGEVRAGFGELLGLSGTAYSTLISIAHLETQEGGVGVSRLAKHLHLSGAFVTIEVTKLVKAGLVAKRTNTKDRRRVVLSLTESGRERLAKLAQVQAPVNDALFGSLSREEFDTLADMMERLVPCGDHALSLLALLTKERAAVRAA